MKKNILIFIVGTILLILGVSFAYYTIQIVGTGSNMVMETAYLRLVLTDNASIVEDSIIPGWSTSKEFTVENKANADTTYDLLIENFQNTFVTNGFLQFKIESEDGYNTVSDDNNFINVPKSQTAKKLVLAHNISLAKDATHEYTISFRYKDSEENQAADMQKVLSGNIGIQNGTESTDLVITDLDSNTLKYHVLSDNGVYNTEWAEERTDFNTAYFSSTNTFFRTNNAELGETVFYYAGDARNNWVIFGQSSNGNDLYWRIIRTNEESTGGGIRLLYAGNSLLTDENGNKIIAVTQNAYIGSSNWNNSVGTLNYVGYTRGTNDYNAAETTISDIRGNTYDSNIKTVVDNWYEKTFLNTVYENKIDTKAVYCSDRSSTSSSSISFSANDRLSQNISSPSYACGANKLFGKENAVWYYYEGNSFEDRYTASKYKINESDEKYFGNGYLDYPIALMTADEVAFAGAFSSGSSSIPNGSAWYYRNSSVSGTTYERSAIDKTQNYWYTMTPFSSTGLYIVAGYYNANEYGNLGCMHYYCTLTRTNLVRPALSLKADTKWLIGDGTPLNPYQIKIEN